MLNRDHRIDTSNTRTPIEAINTKVQEIHTVQSPDTHAQIVLRWCSPAA